MKRCRFGGMFVAIFYLVWLFTWSCNRLCKVLKKIYFRNYFLTVKKKFKFQSSYNLGEHASHFLFYKHASVVSRTPLHTAVLFNRNIGPGPRIGRHRCTSDGEDEHSDTCRWGMTAERQPPPPALWRNTQVPSIPLPCEIPTPPSPQLSTVVNFLFIFSFFSSPV